MPTYRIEKINEEMRKVIAEALRDVKNPAVTGSFVSITQVGVTPDLKVARVYYSHIGGDAKEIQKGMESASGFIRGRAAHEINLRQTPELRFILDTSPEDAQRIEKLLREANK